jgi:hemerythrin-like domain-containing protein
MADSPLLVRLRDDHANAARLLSLLDREVQMVRGGEDADYDVIEGVIDYFKGYPDAYHHPLEDIVYSQLLKAAPERAKKVGDLLADHQAMRRDIADLATALDTVRLEAELPRDNIAQKIEAFVAMYRGHMTAEDERFFPVSAEVLTPADWDDILEKLDDGPDLFFRGKEGFEGLRKRLLAFEDSF